MKVGIALISMNFSGAEKAVYYLLKEFSKIKSIETHLLVNDEILPFYSKIDKITVHNLGKTNKLNPISKFINYIFLRKKISSFIKENNLKFINSHMPLANFICPISETHLIHFNSNVIIKEIRRIPTSLSRLIILPRIKKSLDKSLRIISIGKQQIKDLPQKYKQKTIVIPNGVDSKIFKPLPNIKAKKEVILFAGRFIELKGIREILNVAKQLPQYEFWFAGKGELEKEIIKLPNCKNLGFKDSGGLVELYNKATICIFPSHREAFGNVGLEAMSCGKAVIATPLGFSEYIDDKKEGIIILAKNETALKNAIVDLMTNEKKRKMLEKKARKKALKYSWDKVAEKYLKVFKEVAKKNKSQ